MFNEQFFKANKIDAATLSKFFTNTKADEAGKKRDDLILRVGNRIRDGIKRGIDSHSIFWAIDKAFDVSFNQTTATLVKSLLSYKPDDDRVLNALKAWQIEADNILCDECGEDGKPVLVNGKKKKVLNIPAFFEIYVPVVKAYCTIRWAKMFADRDLSPLFKYEPARFTELNRIRCEILTDRVQMMATQMGYRPTLRQAILQTVMYGECIQFPKESWWRRTIGQSGDKKMIVEGLRYHLPHPTRCYRDMAHRPSTLNTDTGCRFAGHWEIQPWSDIRLNKSYQEFGNLGAVAFGRNNWLGSNETYFKNVYPCVMEYPCASVGRKDGVADNDREQKAEFYTTEMDDKAVFTTNHYQLDVPKDVGFSDYDEPVWFRYVMANEVTPLFVEPMPSFAGIYYGYDTDELRARNTSLALEALPFQDQISNILSQMMLVVRQNLQQVTFYDEGQINRDDIEKLKATGRKRYGERVWIGFSAKENRFSDTKLGEAFHNVQFEKANSVELITAIKTILDILERVLVMSSQEVAQAATHEQTAKETLIIAQTTSVRVNHTGGFIDDAIYAWKNQLYRYLMAYGSPDIYSQVPSDDTITADKLKKLGFTVDSEQDHTDDGPKDDRIKRPVKGNKDNLVMLEGFSSTRDSANRINTDALAGQMVEMFKVIGSSEMLIQSVGVKEIVALINQIMVTAGLPRDFRLKLAGDANTPQASEAIIELTKQIAQRFQQTEQKTVEFVQKSLAEALQPIRQGEQQMAQALAAVESAIPEISKKVEAVAAQSQEIGSVAAQAAQRVQELEQVHVIGPSAPAMGAATSLTQ